jgi:hypothetical protein
MDIVIFDWEPIKKEDAARTKLEISIMRLVFRYQEELRELVLKYLDRNVFLEYYDLSDDIKTIPYKELFNAVEHNLKNLVATNITPEMEFTKIWRGGLLDEKRIDYSDVNRWFKTIQLLNKYIISLQKRYLESGVFYCGVNPDFQVIGIG